MAPAELVGEELAGTFVSPKGLSTRMVGSVAAGLVGGAVAGGIVLEAGRRASELPDFGKLGYVAATPEEVALMRAKPGLLKPKVDRAVLARMPRAAVASAELEPGKLKSLLRIRFADGGAWEFEIPKMHRERVELLVTTLQGPRSADA